MYSHCVYAPSRNCIGFRYSDVCFENCSYKVPENYTAVTKSFIFSGKKRNTLYLVLFSETTMWWNWPFSGESKRKPIFLCAIYTDPFIFNNV